MDLAQFRDLCTELNDLGFSRVSLSGGEPTLLKNLDKYVEIASKYDFAVRLNTSGILLSADRLHQLLDSGLDQLVLSVYGTEFDDVARLRGNKVLAKRMPQVFDAISMVKRNRDFVLITQTAVQKENAHLLPDILKTSFEIGADVFWPSFLENAINYPTLRIREQADIDHFRTATVPALKSVVQNFVKEQRHKEYLEESCDKLLVLDSYSHGIYRMSLPPNCNNPGNFVLVYPDGKIAPCQGCEYFNSGYERNISEIGVDEYLKQIAISPFKAQGHDYCYNCPHGVFVEMRLNPHFNHESQKRVNRTPVPAPQ